MLYLNWRVYMASIEYMKSLYTDEFSWTNGGNNWSLEFASVEAEWLFFIYPKIKRFLTPKSNVLEIAPGYGRWTEYLIKNCKHYIGIDLCENCINVCKNRFKRNLNAKFYTNDGKSLNAVKNNSIDFCFSFDSLVHVDKDAMEPYIAELKNKLKEKSYAFIHHSNLGAYKGLASKSHHMRSEEVDYLYVQEICKKYGLHCIQQELIKWNGDKNYIDCCSLIYKDSSMKPVETKIIYDEYLSVLQDYGRYLAENYLYKNDSDFTIDYRAQKPFYVRCKNFVKNHIIKKFSR